MSTIHPSITRLLRQGKSGSKKEKHQRFTLLFRNNPAAARSTAEEMASDSGRELRRVNLSQVMSPYIGETEKNLQQLFAQAKSKNQVLFFDEADGLFGKRTEVKDAHDKYANRRIKLLLNKLKDYGGIAIVSAR